MGAPVGRWFTARARDLGVFDVEVVDLADLALPFYDEPHHPRLRRYTRDHTRRWSARVDAADAFVFVTAEYNHAYPATLKNALDFLHHEWRDKPLGFVSYGGVAAGTRAVVALEPVVTALRLRPVPDAVNLAVRDRAHRRGRGAAPRRRQRAGRAGDARRAGADGGGPAAAARRRRRAAA